MYDQQKAENSFLAMINACVSHELRNPLNSIIAQNIQKYHLYQKLHKLIDQYKRYKRSDFDDFLQEISLILQTLNAGQKIQESSASIMTFMVQDLLDYAQIKAGKFRKNICVFNIKESIEKVMNI